MSDKPEMTHVDLFLSTADALGLAPRVRREGLDVLREAADRLDGNTDQPDGHKAEMIGACRSTTPHDGHDWQYSDTGYAECPGVPNQSVGGAS